VALAGATVKGLDLGRPDVVFAIIWGSTTWLAYEDLYFMGFDRSRPIALLIGLNILSFFVIYQIIQRAWFADPPASDSQLDTAQVARLHRINLTIFAAWFVLFLFIVFRSGGLPIWWRVQHLQKSYVDFGVATLSGFANMIRCFVFSLSILLVLEYRNRIAALVAGALLFTSLLEMARANTTYLLLCGVAVYVVRRRIRIKALAALVLVGVLFVLAFGWAERYRSPGGSGGEAILQYQSVLNKLPYGVTSVYLYLSTPVSNLFYAEAHGIEPLRFPYFSTQLIVPTIVRDKLYTAHKYPIALRRESYNATTFYSPFVADFGVPAAWFLVCLIQAIVSYVHIKAGRGDFFYQLVYAPLFAALVLSFFFNYFLTLGVVLLPLVVLLVRSRVVTQGTGADRAYS
jgi:oligosaccharide repeat unit polymerase